MLKQNLANLLSDKYKFYLFTSFNFRDQEFFFRFVLILNNLTSVTLVLPKTSSSLLYGTNLKVLKWAFLQYATVWLFGFSGTSHLDRMYF